MSISFRSLALFFVSLLIFSGEATAFDYYVGPGGNDSNDGTTPEQAWETVSRVNQVSFQPGDRILFAGESTFWGTLTLGSEDNGTAAEPVIISSYGEGRATINGGLNQAFYAYNCGGFELRNINFHGAGRDSSNSDGIGIYTDLVDVPKLEHIYLDQVDIGHFGRAGLWIGSATRTSGFRDVRITNADVHSNGEDGMFTFGPLDETSLDYPLENVYVGYSRFFDNTGTPGKNSGSGMYLSGVNGGVVEHCEAFNNGGRGGGGGGPYGIWAYESNNVIIQFNESHHNKTGNTLDGGGFDLDGGMTNSVLQYNYSHDNQGSGYMLCQFYEARPFRNNIIRYNISENDAWLQAYDQQGAIRLYSTLHNSYVHNNTVYVSNAYGGTPTAVAIDRGENAEVYFYNNIFLTGDGMPFIKTDRTLNVPNVVFKNNNYYSVDQRASIHWLGTEFTNLAEWSDASSQEKIDGVFSAIEVDPQLTDIGQGGTFGNPEIFNRYRLLATSPVIDKGLDIQAITGIPRASRDFHGTFLDEGRLLDLGANEYNGDTLVNKSLVP